MYVYSSCLQSCIYKKKDTTTKVFTVSLHFQKIKNHGVSLVKF